MVKYIVMLNLIHGRISSWNQPVMSTAGEVSCSSKQR